MSEIKLFPYQNEGAAFLAGRRLALLADEMGLGKTVQAIRACDDIKARSILVVCPAIARVNWMREFAKFSRLSRSSMILKGQKNETELQSLCVTSYDWMSTHGHNLKEKWDVLILDEAHYLKSIDAKRTKAVFGKEGVCRMADRVWCLTGTPMPNHAGEMWVMIYSFGATKLSYQAFVDKFCTFGKGKYLQITGTNEKNIPELKSMFEAFTLRRKKFQVQAQLPQLVYSDVVIPKDQAGVVDLDIESSFTQYIFPTDRREELKDILRREDELCRSVMKATKFGDHSHDGYAAIEAISKSVSTLRRYIGIQKVEAVGNLIYEELANKVYDKIVIFAIHQGVIEGLRKKLRDFKAVTLYGLTPDQKRQTHIDNFQNNPKYRVFIGNIQACGTAVNLTAAAQVAFVEQSWVVGDNAQAVMRCHRIGQKRKVFVRCFSLEDSIDERVSMVLKAKTRQLTMVFEDDTFHINKYEVERNKNAGVKTETNANTNLEDEDHDSIFD
jgi:SNF2 family DNA or RNA helicase